MTIRTDAGVTEVVPGRLKVASSDATSPAGRWDVVIQLARELEARGLARPAGA